MIFCARSRLLIPLLVFAWHAVAESDESPPKADDPAVDQAIRRTCTVEFGLPFAPIPGAEAKAERVHCQNLQFAIEYAPVRNIHNALGVALYKAMQVGRVAAVAAIVASDEEAAHLQFVVRTIGHYGLPIELFVVRENSIRRLALH